MNDNLSPESCFEIAKQVVQQLRKSRPDLLIANIVENHPHAGYEKVYSCYIPLPSYVEEEKGCFVVSVLADALENLGLDSIESHLATNEGEDKVYIRFSAINSDNLADFLDNLPVALENTIDKVRTFYLDPRYWAKDEDCKEGQVKRVMGPDSGPRMEALFGCHDISTIKSDGAGYYAGDSDDTGATDWTFIVEENELNKLRAIEGMHDGPQQGNDGKKPDQKIR